MFEKCVMHPVHLQTPEQKQSFSEEDNMKIVIYTTVAIALTACQPSAPPEIDTASATVQELQTYIDKNCKNDFRMHVRCINAFENKRKKVLVAGRENKGSIATVRSEAELFRKK